MVKNVGGRPPYVPTAGDRKQALELIGFGHRSEDVARVLGISKRTLEKYFRAELDEGHVRTNIAVQQTAYQMATSGQHVAMTIFWLKTRCGWKETTVVENTGKDGGPIQISSAKAELLKRMDSIVARRNAPNASSERPQDVDKL